ncbi:unnamed protein product, partial [Rotaria sordida]
IDTVEIGGDLEDILSATPEGIELQRNPSLRKMGLLKRVLLPAVEEWFKGILSGLKDAELIVLSVGSVFAGLSCIEKCSNIKAIGIYTFPLLRTAEFSPPGIGRKTIISLVGFQQTHTNQFVNTDHILYLTQNIPHDWLFSNMSAAIHHGGAGTTHASLRYGLPTLILPFAADQPFNGDRVFINKLGPRPIPIRQTNVKNLTKAIRDLISDNYTMYEMNAKKIGELMRNEDELDHCIRLIEAELVA